ncbi:MAG TPA: hypothetical protein VH418_19390 [Solirubrobacteraceae bacterium]
MIALALALLVAAPASAARRAGPTIGIGEQQPSMFTSKWWNRLEIRDARYLAPWDVMQDPYQLFLLDRWMAAARRDHARVVLGFGHSLRNEYLARHLPTWREFQAQFRLIRKRYPWIRNYIPWNEANNPRGMTAHKPRRVAQYFDVVSKNCRHCNVVAADLLDWRNMIPWARAFRRAAHVKPRIWGLHNYGDANHFHTKSTRALLRFTKGQIWFTETGGVVMRKQPVGRKHRMRTWRYGTRHAARSVAHVFQLACMSRRITRVYLYNWQTPRKVTYWDSGIVDGKGRRRPAYFVLQRWMSRSAHASRHGGRRALCG